MKPRVDKAFRYRSRAEAEEWLSIEEEEERERKKLREREALQKRGRFEQTIFKPLDLPNPAVREDEASAVDSDEEAKMVLKEVLQRNRDQALLVAFPEPSAPASEAESPQQKELRCSVCAKTLCPLDGLVRMKESELQQLGWTSERHRADHDDAEAVFEVTKCFAYVFGNPKDRTATCRNGHAVGTFMAGRKFVDKSASVFIALPDGQRIEWNSLPWKNNFEIVGGSATPPSPRATGRLGPAGGGTWGNPSDANDVNSYFCQICHVKCRSRRAFLTHISSRKHKEEEEYVLGRS